MTSILGTLQRLSFVVRRLPLGVRSLGLGGALLILGGCATAAPPAWQEQVITGPPNEIVARYYVAIGNVCETGVTPELVALHRAVEKIWDANPTGSGRGSNFGGARDPKLAWWACFQSPGWL